MQSYTAIKTEFRGVKMKSKTEAVFARNLELHGYQWSYEPPELQIIENGQKCSPDFLVTRPAARKLIIELKPADVTGSCLERYKNRFGLMKHNLDGAIPVVCCGSSFVEPKDRRSYVLENGIWVDMEPKLDLFKHIMEASKFKFDLK